MSEPQTSERPLRRSRDDRVIAGVAAGLARYLGVDPALVRFAFVLLALAGGTGILLYLVAAVVIAEEEPGAPSEPPDPERVSSLRKIAGWTLVGIGGALLVERFFPSADRIVWPLAILALGAAILTQGSRRS